MSGIEKRIPGVLAELNQLPKVGKNSDAVNELKGENQDAPRRESEEDNSAKIAKELGIDPKDLGQMMIQDPRVIALIDQGFPENDIQKAIDQSRKENKDAASESVKTGAVGGGVQFVAQNLGEAQRLYGMIGEDLKQREISGDQEVAQLSTDVKTAEKMVKQAQFDIAHIT